MSLLELSVKGGGVGGDHHYLRNVAFHLSGGFGGEARGHKPHDHKNGSWRSKPLDEMANLSTRIRVIKAKFGIRIVHCQRIVKNVVTTKEDKSLDFCFSTRREREDERQGF